MLEWCLNIYRILFIFSKIKFTSKIYAIQNYMSIGEVGVSNIIYRSITNKNGYR